jgi:hypothetical protein
MTTAYWFSVLLSLATELNFKPPLAFSLPPNGYERKIKVNLSLWLFIKIDDDK